MQIKSQTDIKTDIKVTIFVHIVLANLTSSINLQIIHKLSVLFILPVPDIYFLTTNYCADRYNRQTDGQTDSQAGR